MKADKNSLRDPALIESGLPKLDELLDGGVNLKRIAQFSGRYSVGKSTVALLFIANAQKMGLDTLWLDTEQRFPFDYAVKMGVDLGKLELANKKFAEELFDFAEDWTKKHEGLIVLDSIGGLLSKKEAESLSGEEGYPHAPRLIPAFLRRIVMELAEHNCGLILLNHEKEVFGTHAIKVLGGKAVEFHSDKWIRLRQLTGKKIMQGEKRIGDVIEASVQKGPKKGEATELHLLAGKGFSVESDKLEEALKDGFVVRLKNSYFVGEQRIGVGVAQAMEWLKNNG